MSSQGSIEPGAAKECPIRCRGTNDVMTAKFQITIDCQDPARMCEFWAAALGYVVEPPPEGFATWEAYYKSMGLPDEELGTSPDCLIDPTGRGPRIWFQVVDEPKPEAVKNRLHFDLHAGGGRSNSLAVRRNRVDAEASRLTSLGAKQIDVYSVEGVDHYAVAMLDPEGNEFDIL